MYGFKEVTTWLAKPAITLDGDTFTRLDLIKSCAFIIATLLIIAVMGK